MIGEPAADGVKEVVPLVQCADIGGIRADLPVGRGAKRIHPGVERRGRFDRHALVGPPGGEDLHVEAWVGGDGLVVHERIDRVVRRTDHDDLGAGHQSARREIRIGQARIARFPDGVGRLRAEQVGDPEVTRQLEVGPVIERIAQQVRHRGGPLVEFLTGRGVARAVALGHAVAAHGAPLVVVAAQPDLAHVGIPLVRRNLGRGEVAVVVDNRQIARVVMV